MGQTMTAGDPTRVVGRRAIGYVFDSVIDVIVLLLFTSLVGVQFSRLTRVGVTEADVNDTMQKFAVAMGLYALYYLTSRVITLGWLGWTPGMLITGVRCVRWDGRPCGPIRAFVRSLVMLVGGTLFSAWILFGGIFFLGGSLLLMSMSRGHKNPGDFAAGTYVIDVGYSGRLIIETANGLMTGPPSVRREEAEKYLRKQGVPAPPPGTFVPPLTASAKNGDPFHDKNLDTYVVWNAKQGAWLAFDKATGAWNQVG